MFEGTRLNYVVPGYTGHIPKKINYAHDTNYTEVKPDNQIPGYAGFVHSIKSENMFSQTYGKITYKIQHHDHYVGQDVPPELRYTSHFQDTFQNQKNVALRTAAEVVGVPKSDFHHKVPEDQKDKFTDSMTRILNKERKCTSTANLRNPLKLGEPVPGYTGTQKRIVAANIFGQTFANARVSALNDEDCIQHNRKKNYFNQSTRVPDLKK